MTTTISLLCPEGIVLAADSREGIIDPYTGNYLKIRDNVKKIISLKNTAGVAMSCWGLATVSEAEKPDKDIIPFLEEFNNTTLEKGDRIEQVANCIMHSFRVSIFLIKWSISRI